MSHGVTDIDRVAVRIGKRTWHDVNTFEIPLDASFQAWIEGAGLDRFTIEMRPLYTIHPEANRYPSKSGSPDYWTKSDDLSELPRHKAITRVGPGALEETFAVVSDKYHPVQPLDQAAFVNQFAEAGDVSMETMGTLLGGRKVWALLSLGESWEIDGGRVDGYVLVVNHNDGTGAFRIMLTMIWVQCNNTLTSAVSRTSKSLDMKLTHRTRWTPELMKSVKQHTGLVRTAFQEQRGIFEKIASIHLTRPEVHEFVAKLSGSADAFVTHAHGKPVADGAAVLADMIETRELAGALADGSVRVDPDKLNRVGQRVLAQMLAGSPGAKALNGGLGGMDVLNNATYYYTHDKRIARSASAAMDSSISGAANRSKQKAVELLLEKVEVAA